MKKVLLVLTVFMLLITSTACSSSKPNTGDDQQSSQKTTMHIELITAPVGMHPLKTNDSPSTYVGGQIFETLYERTVGGTEYVPLLAESMPEYSDDQLTATIHLRKGVTFHDGTPFTADAVAYMIDSIKDPDYGSQRKSIVESIESYEIIDENTIALHLAYVDGVLVSKLAHTNSAIVNPELDKTKDLLIDPTGAGTGAYEFVSSVPGSTYTLKANENYWNGAPEVKEVVYDVVADEATAVARLQTGEADFLTGVSADAYNTVSNISGYTTINETNSSIYYLGLRSNEAAINPLMSNVEFRKAIIEAIDFNTFIDTMLNGLASRSQSIVGPTLVGYVKEMENAGYTYNLEDAKKIVEDNGWAGQEITLFTSTRKWQQDLAVYMQAELAEVGIKLNIVSEEWASFLTNAKEDKKFDIIILTWSNVTGDGQQMLEPNFSTANGLRVKYNNAEFDEMVQNSVYTTVLEERQACMLEAVNKLQGDAVATPIYTANQVYTYNSNDFAGVKLGADGQFNIKDFKLAK